MHNTAIYPGSFDPCTNGHLDIIERSARIFDRVVVAVLTNSVKTPCFSIDERMNLLLHVTSHLDNVEIDCFSGLLADYATKKSASVIIRGLRAMSDFEYEFQMALTNKKLNNAAETMFLTTSAENMYLSSSVVREIAMLGGAVNGMVPPYVEHALREKYK